MNNWWRRNRWGLIALVPVLATTVWLSWGDAYDRYWKRQPNEPVRAGSDGWVSFAGARMRLEGLGEGEHLTVFGGEKFTPPSGTAVWEARIAFDAPKPDDLGGCQIKLQDSAGTIYDASPVELSSVRVGAERVGFASCTPDFDETAKTKYERAAYFLTPASIRPAAVRIILPTQNPRYA